MESNLFMIRRKFSSPDQDSSKDFNLLEGLDSAAESFLSTGKTKKALDCMNQALKIRINLYGDSSKEVLTFLSQLLKKTCASCSSLIEKGKLPKSIELLRNSLVLSSNYPLSQISSETCELYNTLSCALRKNNKPKLAKKYALKGLSLANTFKASEKLLSSIYLNLCAIYSSLSKHKEAAAYCMQAIQLAQEDLLNLKLSRPQEDYHQEVAVLAVAYHNLGVEEEYLKHYEIALSWYRKAIKFLEKHASSSHFSMLEEFRKSYEDAQRACKLKYQHVHMNRTMKDEYFFDESSLSELDVKSMSVKSKTQSQGFKVNGFTKIPNLPIGRIAIRSGSGSSFGSNSKRHKIILELDSDIRELHSLGLLEHNKTSSRRSRSTVKSGELSPIKKQNSGQKIPVQSTPQAFDYSENVFKIRTAKESARHQKVVKREEKDHQFLLLKSVLRIQSYFRLRRLRRWYKEVQNGKLFGLMLKCEKIINGQKYLVSFTIEKTENSLRVAIRAMPLIIASSPEPGIYTLFDVCALIGAWDTKSFEMKKSELLIYIYIEDNKVVLRKTPEIYLINSYQGAKRLNNMFTYQISIYSIINPSSEPSLLIDGRPLKKSPPIIRVLIISVKELSSILSVKTQDLQRNLDKVLNLVIFEGDGELTLSKRSISADIPMINILTTNTDDFNDQYKQYENSSKRVNKEEKQNIKFCCDNNEEKKAALIIQKNFKAKEERKKFLTVKRIWNEYGNKSCKLGEFYKAVLLVQRFVKKWKAKKDAREKERRAVVKIQKGFRAWMERKLKSGKDAEEVQEKGGKGASMVKKHKDSSKKPAKDVGNQDRDKAATKIQSKFRSNMAKKRYQQEKLRTLNACILIQRAVRQWKLKKSKTQNPSPPTKSTVPLRPRATSSSRKKYFNAILIIQKFIKAWRARAHYKQLKLSTIKIQKNFRGFLSRKIFKQKILQIRALKLIQSHVKKWLAKKRAEKVSMKEMEKASVVIQKYYKGKKARNSYMELKKRREFESMSLNLLKYVVMVQRVFRGYKVRKQMRKEKVVQEKSALLIQKVFKGLMQRKKFLFLIQLNRNSQKKIDLGKYLKAVITIQKYVKGWKVRKDKVVQEKSALLIQKVFKGLMQRKKFLLLIQLNRNSQKKIDLGKYLKAVITIQRYVKGWKVRKMLKNKRDNKGFSYLKSIIIIQKHVKRWLANKHLQDLISGSSVIGRFGVVSENEPYLVTISKTTNEYIVKFTHSLSLKSLYRKFKKSSTDFSTLQHQVCIRSGSIRISNTKNVSFQVKIHETTKTFASEDFNIAVFLEPQHYYITFTNTHQSISQKLSFSELARKYSDQISVSELIEDLVLVNNKIVLPADVILVKKSKLVKGKLYTITMYEKRGSLVFEVMFGSSSKKRIVMDLKEAVEQTGIYNGVIALGYYLIEHCFIFRGKQVSVVCEKRDTDNLHAIIKLQAFIRGFLTRKYLKTKNLILVTDKVIKGLDHKLYCYYSHGKFSIKAKSASGSYTLTIEKFLDSSKTLKYLRKSIIPSLTLTETSPIRLVSSAPTLHTEKHPKILNLVDKNKSSNKPSLFSVTPNLNMSSKKLEKLPEKSAVYKKRSKNSSQVEEMSISVQSEQLSPQSTPTIYLKKSRREISEALRSISAEKIVLKTGACVSGIYLIVTMKLVQDGIYVQAVNETGIIDLDLFIKTKKVMNAGEKEVEDLCSELLMQLKIVSDRNGKMSIALIDSSDDEKDEVMYKRSHYISNRYFTVTIFENFRGVFLVACENEKNVFHMKLGRRRVGNSKKTQEELNELVKRLRVQVVLGQEMLVLST